MRAHSGISLVGLPLGAIVFLWLTRTSPVTSIGILCAFLLLLLPWASFLSWRQQRGEGLPVFAMVGFMYWWWFAIGMFWLERTHRFGRRMDIESVDGAMLLALVGVVCMGVGMRVRVPLLPAFRRWELDDKHSVWLYVRSVLVAGTVGSMIPGVNNLLGPDARQIMEILLSTVPMVALMLVLRKCLRDEGSIVDRALLWIYFPVRILGGLSSGWVGSVAGTGLICGAMYFLVRKKVPWTMVAVSVVAVLFLQVGKKEFRHLYWGEESDAGIVEKAAFWLEGSALKWSQSLESEGNDASGGLANESLERTSLLPQVAHVLDLTPRAVPFQRGKTYSYMVVALIPRIFWPEKPSVNDANRTYQILYGLNTSKNVGSVNIGAGCLTEAYINFGWPGVICIMFAIGVVLSVYERGFLSRDSSAFFLAIGLALLQRILGIESQMSAYLGGVIQNVLLTILVFLPVLRRRSSKVKTALTTPRIVPMMPQLRVRPGR